MCVHMFACFGPFDKVIIIIKVIFIETLYMEVIVVYIH